MSFSGALNPICKSLDVANGTAPVEAMEALSFVAIPSVFVYAASAPSVVKKFVPAVVPAWPTP